MLFSSQKTLCGPCTIIMHWLTGLTLLAIGVIGLLQKLDVFAVSPWSWAWPVITLVWGLVILFSVGCKDCGK